MRAKGWAMRVMRATVKILRIFVCYNFFGMRTRTRATEQDEYERNIEFLQRLHKLSPKRVLISQWEQEQEQQNMIIKFLQRLHKPSPRRVLNQPIRSYIFYFRLKCLSIPHGKLSLPWVELSIFKRECVSKRYEYQNWAHLTLKVIPQYCITHPYCTGNSPY